jgi:hypothetical protein
MKKARVGKSMLLVVLAVATACGALRKHPEDAGPELTVIESNAAQFRARVDFDPASFATVQEAGESFTLVEIAGCRARGAKNGQPGLPLLTRLLAVPQGARAVVKDVRVVTAEQRVLLLHPFQAQEGEYSPAFEQPGPIPLDQDDWEPPFAFDRGAYALGGLTPAAVVEVSAPSEARDISVAVLQVAAGQYAPASRQLTLYSSVEFTVSFEGGSGVFLRSGAGNPFEPTSKIAQAATWNKAAIGSVSEWKPWDLFVQGEELLILTHPDYRAAADRLAIHKESRGLVTTVVNVNDGPGGGPDTKEEIKAWLDERYAEAQIRFSYLLLIGDAEDIAPWVLPRRYKDGEFPSDFPYGQIDTDPMADDLFPEIAVGRLAVETLAEADVVVDKIIKYEAEPPQIYGNGSFYRQAAIASYFQPGGEGKPDNQENKRRFIQDSEWVRDNLTGFDTQRIYIATLPLTEENTPRFYRDGVTELPSPLAPEDDYPWDGDGAQIVAAFNAGKSLFFHCDHGAPSGWGHPHFTTNDLPSLTNGELLPLVLSDNCSSGRFDGTDGFAESILRRSGGGAIGVMAFTRNSNSGVGRQFLVGAVDALWPDAYDDGDEQEHLRLGDMLDHARGVMTMDYTSAGPDDDGYLGAWCYARMLTLFGDPTLEVWRDNPMQLPDLGEWVDGPVLDFVYPWAGATITVVQQQGRAGDVPVARGVVGADGVAHLVSLVKGAGTGAGSLRVFASAPGAVAKELSVPAGQAGLR